eukprot:767904-Hanusia_phi.AAC.6
MTSCSSSGLLAPTLSRRSSALSRSQTGGRPLPRTNSSLMSDDKIPRFLQPRQRPPSSASPHLNPPGKVGHLGFRDRPPDAAVDPVSPHCKLHPRQLLLLLVLLPLPALCVLCKGDSGPPRRETPQELEPCCVAQKEG